MNLRQSPLSTTRHSQHGVSLLEVLIAVVVLSIGLLGLAGLQLSALRNNQSAAERSAAIMQVYSITEAMRADMNATQTGAFEIGIDDSSPTGSTFALKQLAAWRERLKENLGASATGGIDCDTTSAPIDFTICTVTIRWDDSLGLGGSSTQTLTTEVEI